MRKIHLLKTIFFWLCICLVHASLAQQRTVTGKVTGDGDALPGVNILLQGSTDGTVTDGNGYYSIQVPGDDAVLIFSVIGFKTQTITAGNRTTIDVIMEADVTQLQEVIVTALGVEREVKALNYSVTEVRGENLTMARENNVAAALSGRIAGVNVNKIAAGPAASTRIVIRGNKSLGGQNQPLYVVDGIPIDNTGTNSEVNNYGQAGLWGGRDEGDGMTSINPDDIESITVLKGASAAALYGSRGGNGVVNIVTKKGFKRKGLGITVNSNYVVEKAINLSDLQTKYGAGQYVSKVATAPATADQAFSWGNLAWGPRMDGSPVIQFDGIQRPYAYAGDNWKRFYRTGSALTNSIAITGGGENQTFRLSIADLRSESILPNSGFDRTNVTLSTNGRFADKLTVNAKVMYSHEDAHNRPRLSDSPGNAVQSIWRTPPNINVETYKGDPHKSGAIAEGTDPALLAIYGQGGDPKFAGQELLPAANNWGQNPYWATQQYIDDDLRDRVLTSGEIRYDVTDYLYASTLIGMDWYTRRDKSLVPEGTGYLLGGSLSEGEDRIRETNMQWMLGFNKTFNLISVNAFIGGNRMRKSAERIAANGTGFNVEFFPAINNAATRNYEYKFWQSGINSLFASTEVGYKSIVFITATLRKDWFSVLNPENNDIPYPSIGGSFVFSDAFSGLPQWLSFGKLRASWAQVGTANVDPYKVNLTYSLNSNTHLGRTMATFSSANNNKGIIPNADLVPATSTEIEIGFDVRLFSNRVGLDFTYYSQKTTEDILTATISRASGFGSTFVNVGELSNKGVEILLTGTALQGPLTWDVSLNMAKNSNKVIQLIDGVTEVVGEEPRTRNVFIKHIVGYPFGMITGHVQQTSPAGEPVFDNEGRPVTSGEFVPIGNGIADWTGGLNNAFSYKNVNLSFLIDFKFGGDIFSGTNNRLTQWGLHKQSLIGRDGETPLHIKGVINTGSNEAPVYTPVDRDLTPDEARIYWNSVGGEATGISSMFMYDASFVKLRQITLGYDLPNTLLSGTPFRQVSISFVARNLAILSKNIDNVDPESSYSSNAGAQGLEYFAMPTTRSYGFNIRVGF